MDDAFDFAFGVDDGEVGKAGFVKFVEDERTEDFFALDKDHFVLGNHEVFDLARVKAHDGGDAIAICIIDDVARGAPKDVDKVCQGLRGIFGGLG